jgi:hypothetical protein
VLCITFSCVKIYVMEPNVFLGCLERGIVVWPNEGIAFLLCFERDVQYPLNCPKI